MHRLSGREAIAEISRFNIIAKGELSTQTVLADHSASLQLNTATSQRVLHGVITQFKLRQLDATHYHLNATFCSSLAILAKQYSRHVFTEQTVSDCAYEILSAQYRARQIQLRLQKPLAVQAYCIQSPYESDWEFLLRLLSDAGLILFEDQQQQMASIVLCDDRMQHPLADPWSPQLNPAGPGLQIDNTTQQQGFVLHSTECAIQAGYRRRVQCKTDHFTLDRQCVITAVEHSLVQTASTQCAYHNRVSLLPAPQALPLPQIAMPPFPNFMPAESAGTSDQVSLDPQGRYRIHFDWDSTSQTLPPLPRVTAKAGGMHLPLAGGQTVLVSCLNGDAKQLCMTAAVPQGVKPNLIDPQRPYSNRWLSAAGQEIVFCDHPTNTYCCVQSPNGYNHLRFSAQGIELGTQGSLHLNAADKIVLHAGRDLKTQLSAQLNVTVEQNLQISAQRGSVRLKAQGDIILQSQADSQWSADTITLQCQQQTVIRALQNLNLQAQQIHCQSQADLHMNAEGDIVIQGDGNGDISLHQGNTQIRLTAGGDLELIADTINFSAKQSMSCEGKVNIID